MDDWKGMLKKVWHFIWEDNSIWSWLVNIALAFVLIKYIVYPGLGFLLQTSHPVVAVVSESMEHNGNFDDWWRRSGSWYSDNGINKDSFSEFQLRGGFNKGDIMVLKGKKPENIEVGDVVVFWSQKKDPIIHRVVKKWQERGAYYFQTKGDNNQFPIKGPFLDETKVSHEQIVGKAVARIPMIGYVKIVFVGIIDFFRGIIQKGGLLS
ncbi:signal peptidase I [Candidatus Woesearchaeota archaeon]|nr:signal peptidase I [Candidatus Woesearchaeota archaeon]